MQNWLELDDDKARRYGHAEVACRHRFADSGLFTDEAIAALIERYPRAHYNVTTMNRVGEQRFWRDGELGDLSGTQVLEAIRNGHIWLNLRHLEQNAPDIGDLISSALAEIRAFNPRFRADRQNTGLLISSPGASVHCHADVPMIALWHLRGRKRIWLWDPHNPRFLPDQKLESIVLRETEEDSLEYTPDWDANANVYDLEPGDSVSWPLNAPHRVANLDGLNMSLTTEFLTPEAKRKYGVYYANGVMRRMLGITPRSTSISGPLALGKCGAALAVKKLGLHPTRQFEFVSTFRVDPDAPDGVRLLAPEECRPIELT